LLTPFKIDFVVLVV